MERWHLTAIEVWERVHPNVVVYIPQDMSLTDGLQEYMRIHSFSGLQKLSIPGLQSANSASRLSGAMRMI